MAAEKSPAFQLYVNEFRSSRSVQRMTFAERGMYLEMLMEEWQAMNLPDDANAVADLIATTDAQHAEVVAAWPTLRRKFVAVADAPGRIENVKLEEVRRERRNWLRTQRASGRAGGLAKARNRQATEVVKPLANPSEPTNVARLPLANSSSSSASSSSSSSASIRTPDRVRALPQMNGTLDDEVAERAGRFLDRYAELYPLHRRGARYLPKPALDFPKACELCEVWDNDRLERLAIVFLKCEEPFAQQGSRTIGQFAAMASWADSRLREVEVGA